MVLANPWPSLLLQRWAERCPARGLGTLDVMALRQFLRVILPPFDARDEGRLRRWDRERKPNRQTERRGGRRDKEASSYAHAEATRFALRFANSLFKACLRRSPRLKEAFEGRAGAEILPGGVARSGPVVAKSGVHLVDFALQLARPSDRENDPNRQLVVPQETSKPPVFDAVRTVQLRGAQMRRDQNGEFLAHALSSRLFVRRNCDWRLPRPRPALERQTSTTPA